MVAGEALSCYSGQANAPSPHRQMDTTTAFDRRLPHVPSQWRDALVEVIDTAGAICLGLQQPDFGVANPATECPQLVAELTRLACERYDAAVNSVSV